MHNNPLELIILEELKKELEKIDERTSPWEAGAAPGEQVRTLQQMKDSLANQIEQFQTMAQSSYDRLQNEIDQDPELLQLASQFPEFMNAWGSIQQFIIGLEEFVTMVERAEPPVPA